MVEHLTQNQLSAYAKGSLAQGESRDVGKHLLDCGVCRNSLPAPTPQQFLTVLMSEKREKENREDFQTEESSFAVLPFLSHFSVFFRQRQTLVWSGAAMVLFLCLTYLIWLNAAQSSNMESEIAQLDEKENTEFIIKQNGDEQIYVPPPFPKVELNNSSVSSEKKNQLKQNTVINSRNNFNQKIKGKIPKENKENITLTRGASQKSSDKIAIEMEVESVEEAVVFRWKKIPKAAKYHLYISDEEEILVDQYETDQETSYVLKKSLDPNKSYKWKMIITLENGNTINGAAQKITVRDYQSNKKQSEKKRKAEIRCLVND